jgi:hypothetical protein
VPFGMKLPAWSATSTATAPTSKTNVLAPVQQVLGGVQNLLQKLLGRR